MVYYVMIRDPDGDRWTVDEFPDWEAVMKKYDPLFKMTPEAFRERVRIVSGRDCTEQIAANYCKGAQSWR